jgi:ribosomal protein L17
MTRHVANGGKPYDEFGQHIISTSEDIAKLNSFSRYVTNKDQLNDNAGDIIEQTKMKLENLRNYVRNLSKQSHYEEASKNFKTSDEVVLDDETVNKLREKFTMKNLDARVEDALPIINKIMSELEATQEKSIEEKQVNELDPGDEPIDAPIQPPVDHGAVVQSFLTDPDSKLILRKDDTADKMLSRTKFTNKNTMLSSILSDIASRLLTKTGEEDRVANFASRVADEMDQENSATFKPTPDYIKNKKIAVQLAKRYIDDYKKMQSDPAFKDEVRMDPEAFNPKKHPKLDKRARGEAAEFESWAESVVNEYAKEPKDEKDKAEKLKAIHDLEMDPKLKDPESIEAIKKRKAELMKSEDAGEKIANMAQNMTRDEFMSHADELGLSPEEAAEHYEKMSGGAHAGKFEGNQFAQAVNKAKAAGMKAGDKFKVGDQEYTLKDAIELAGLDLNEFYSEDELATEQQIERIKELSIYQ